MPQSIHSFSGENDHNPQEEAAEQDQHGSCRGREAQATQQARAPLKRQGEEDPSEHHTDSAALLPAAPGSLTWEGREILIDAQDFLLRQNAFECSHGRPLLAILDNTQEFFLTAFVMPNGRHSTAHPSSNALRPVAV
jgi:hypothetical protein